MIKILGLLSGSAGPWLILGTVLACLAAGGTGGYVARGVIDAPALAGEKTATATALTAVAQCKADNATARANGSEQVVGALNDGIATLNDATGKLNALIVARDKSTAAFMEKIANAPKTFVCGSSAAVRAYRDSVQDGQRPSP